MNESIEEKYQKFMSEYETEYQMMYGRSFKQDVADNISRIQVLQAEGRICTRLKNEK